MVARNEVRLMRSEVIPMALYWVMPLAIMAFIEGAFSLYLEIREPDVAANGASLAAPGQATMFGFMSLALFGYFFLGEYGWGTWNRVRSMGVTSREVMVGKMMVAYCQQLLLFTFVIGAGAVLFGLRVAGSWAALIVLELVVAFVVVTFGLVACALSRTQAQFNAFAYLGALVLAGLGGALVPFQTLPGWARAIAPATPTYWAVEGFEGVILRGEGVAGVATELFVLAAFGAGLLVLGVALFDDKKQRSTWA